MSTKIAPETMWRSAAVYEARRWIGTPFRHQGRLRGQGVDCVGFLLGVARALDLEVHDQADYGEVPSPAQLMSAMHAHCDRTSAVDLEPTSLQGDSAETHGYRPGDLVVFALAEPSMPQHVGIVTDAGFIHAQNTGPRVVREQRWSRFWTNRLHSVWSFRWPLSS